MMIDDLKELHQVSFHSIAYPFIWNDGTIERTVYLKREDTLEVENSNQNVFRGLTEEIQDIKNGDTFKSDYYKNGKELKVISVQYWGDDANWILITAEDIEVLNV